MNRSLSRHWPLLALLLLACPVMLFKLDGYSLVNEDEDVYHQMALAMTESGNWFRLEVRGEPRIYDTFMNAPTHYWLRAVLIELFGSNLWTMRLLSAVMGIATVGMTYVLGNFLRDRWTGALAGLVQLTTFQFVFLHGARTGELDTALSFLMALVSYLFLRSVEGRRSFVAHHAALFLLATVKLPLVMIPLLAEGVALLCISSWRPRFRAWIVTLVCMAPIAMAWHIGQFLRLGPDAIEVALTMWGEASGTHFEGGPLTNLAFYARALAFGAFPYCLVYPLASVFVARTALSAECSAQDARRLALLAAFPIAILGFFLGVSKHYPWYVLPAYPFLSVAVALWLRTLLSSRVRWAATLPLALCAAAVFAIEPGYGSFNPFEARAFVIDMDLAFRNIGGLSPFIAVPAIAALLAGAAIAFEQRRTQGFARLAPVALIAILFSAATLRVVAAMQFLDYTSPMAALRMELDAARSEIPFPVELPIPKTWDARFYIEPIYELRLVESSNGPTYLIFPRSRPEPVSRVSEPVSESAPE